ncbi:MAG TPA: NUDIX hydrolase [Burkholderiales bacterium]|nr:NUDIX hydrolase [Burkholderiales bacterium]
MIWKPNVTVAAVIEINGRFLLVEEKVDSGAFLNQPAGHLEANETILQGVVRETLEETGYEFSPQSLVGIYRWRHLGKNVTYLRFTFCGDAMAHDRVRQLDEGIIAARWMTYDEVVRETPRHRSPMVLRCIDDYLAGRRYPLDILTHL